MHLPLLTIITAPKPFSDYHTTVIQRNALKSWTLLGNDIHVIVMGNDNGVAEVCRKFNLKHIPGVALNENGTPLINSMLELARSNSDSPFLGIVNADIVLFPDLKTALEKVQSKFEKFLLVGQRWDINVDDELPANERGFLDFQKTVLQTGILHPPMGSDYFIFPRDCYQNIPAFAIGRAGWDNWFIFKSRWEGWPVVDGSKAITVAHQNHDYRHLPGGQPHYRLPETKINVELGGGDHTIFTLQDANFQLSGAKIIGRKITVKHLLREIEIFPLVIMHSNLLGRLFYLLARPKKLYSALRNLRVGSRNH